MFQVNRLMMGGRAALAVVMFFSLVFEIAAQENLHAVDSANPQSARRRSPARPEEKKSSDAAGPTVSVSESRPQTRFVYSTSDSLDRIAAACGTSAADILKGNNLRRSELRDGQVLQVPRVTGDDAPAAFSKERQLAREVWRGIRGGKRVALTFDAGGEKDGADDLLRALEDTRTPATFFVTGEFAAKHKDLIKRFAKAGRVHNHSWSHPEFTTIHEDKMAEELERTDWAISDITGKSTKPFWRPPFGDRDARVLRATAQIGYQSIYWTLDSHDSVGEKKDPDYIVQRVLSGGRTSGDPEHYLDGAIILMHVGEVGTARAVPVVVAELRQRGFTLVTVEEILQPPSRR